MFNKRVVIVDFNHQAYSQFFSRNKLSVKVKNALESGKIRIQQYRMVV